MTFKRPYSAGLAALAVGMFAATAACAEPTINKGDNAWMLTSTVRIWLLNTLASVVRGTGNMRVPSLTLLGAAMLQIGFGGAPGLGLGPIPRFGLPGVAFGLV